MFKWRKSTGFLERAEATAKQMRYFRLFSQRGQFDQLCASARRAGFEVIYQVDLDREAAFRWVADADHPDFTFHLSFEDPEAVLVTAESYGDIFGLIMTSSSNLPKINIEPKASLEQHELGRNALQFRRTMLTFSDFDDGTEAFLRRFRL